MTVGEPSGIWDSAMHVALIANREYLPHSAAMINSVLEKNAGESLVLHLFTGPELPAADSAQFMAWVESRGGHLRVHVVPDEALQGFPDRHFHRSVWYRTLMPDLLPNLPRVLYLDSDTIVLDRLRPLWDLDLGGHLFAAVINPLYPFMENWPVNRLGLPSELCYLNSGVLLMDLEAMRREQVVALQREYASQNPDNRFPEQDALAAVLHERCRFVHPRWNVQTTLFDLPAHQLPFTPDEVKEAREHAAIVHFIGPFKPDHYLSRHPNGPDYVRHRHNTPWPLRAIAGRNPINCVLRRIPMAWQYAYFVNRGLLIRQLRSGRT